MRLLPWTRMLTPKALQWVAIARTKSGHQVHSECETEKVWELYTPASPRVEPCSAEHAIDAFLEQRILTQMLRPCWHFLEPVAHHIGDGTHVCWHERVDLWAYQLARNAVGGKGGHARTTVVCTLPAHRIEHGALLPASSGSVDMRTDTSSGRGSSPTRPRRSW